MAKIINNDSFIWSESGLRLLSIFHYEIERAGGARLTAIAIEREWGLLSCKLYGNKRIWSRSDEQYLVDNFANTPMPELSIYLNRTQDAIYSKYTLLKAKKSA